MSKNILLINPWIYDFAAYDFWLKPLGLLYLGGLLRTNGHRVHLIDCLDPYHPAMRSAGKIPSRRTYGTGKFFRQLIAKPDSLRTIPKKYCRYGVLPEIFRQDLNKHRNADIVLMTSLMTYWYPGVLEAIRIVKEVLPAVPVVLGGKYATLCREHAERHSGADYVMAGAGEMPVLKLFEDLFGEEASFSPDELNLDSYPLPAYDLMSNVEQISLATSRGCPYRCSYCASHMLNDKFLRRDPVKVAHEIAYWHDNFGIKDFSFYDDALLIRPQEMIKQLLAEVKKKNLSCNFHCPNGLHLREIDEEVSRLLYESNFKTIRFGFETSDSQRQMESGGKVKNEELLSAVRNLKRAGYSTDDIGIYLLCGLPGQRAGEVKESIDFVRDCGARPVLAEYSPIPGTRMWDDAVALSPFDIQGEPLYHNNSLLPCRSDDFSFEKYNELKASLREEKQGY
jgi:radical SAM superfamily enzyme YgiQ (UPF0313 family)